MDKIKSLLFGETHPSDIYLPSFLAGSSSATGPKAYFTWIFFWRVFCFTYFLVVVIYNWIKYHDWDFYFCYLTSWGWWVEGFTSLLAVISTIIAYKNHKNEPPGAIERGCNYWERATCILFSISTSVSIIVSILYWALLFDPASGNPDFLNVAVHATNVCMSIFQLFSARITPYPTQIVIIIILSLIYIPVNAGCSIANNGNVYSVLDWLKPTSQTYIIAFGAVAGVSIAFLVVWGLCFLRNLIFKVGPKHRKDCMSYNKKSTQNLYA